MLRHIRPVSANWEHRTTFLVTAARAAKYAKESNIFIKTSLLFENQTQNEDDGTGNDILEKYSELRGCRGQRALQT